MARQIGLGLAAAMLLLLTACKNTAPTMLDLTQHYTEAFPEPKAAEGSATNLNGLQQFDGLPGTDFRDRGRRILLFHRARLSHSNSMTFVSTKLKSRRY